MSDNCGIGLSRKRLKLDPTSMRMAMQKILTRLPAKSVSRFRCVCSQWYSLTLGYDFSSLHFRNELEVGDFGAITLNLAEDDNGFSLNHYNFSGSPSVVFSYKDGKGDFVCDISNSCNGLLCVFLAEYTIVVNPCTQDYIRLPKSRPNQDFSYIPLGGLGFIVSTGEYKVVRMQHCVWGTKMECEIFTLGTRTWRKIDDSPFLFSESARVFIDGKFFWEVSRNGVEFFDIEKEIFGLVSLPNPNMRPWGLGRRLKIGDWAGHVCMLDVKQYESQMDLWILQDSVLGIWKKLVTTDTLSVDRWSNAYNREARPMVLWNGKLLLADDHGRLDYYDIHNERFHMLYNRSSGDRFTVVHVESQVSPRVIQGEVTVEDCADMDVEACSGLNGPKPSHEGHEGSLSVVYTTINKKSRAFAVSDEQKVWDLVAKCWVDIERYRDHPDWFWVWNELNRYSQKKQVQCNAGLVLSVT